MGTSPVVQVDALAAGPRDRPRCRAARSSAGAAIRCGFSPARPEPRHLGNESDYLDVGTVRLSWVVGGLFPDVGLVLSSESVCAGKALCHRERSIRQTGLDWWQNPGYRTWGQLASFGRSLDAPSIQGLQACGIHSIRACGWTALSAGTASTADRVPWNLRWMEAGAWLALLPMGLLIVGRLDPLAKGAAQSRGRHCSSPWPPCSSTWPRSSTFTCDCRSIARPRRPTRWDCCPAMRSSLPRALRPSCDLAAPCPALLRAHLLGGGGVRDVLRPLNRGGLRPLKASPARGSLLFVDKLAESETECTQAGGRVPVAGGCVGSTARRSAWGQTQRVHGSRTRSFSASEGLIEWRRRQLSLVGLCRVGWRIPVRHCV